MTGSRHLTLLFSELIGLGELSQRLGDVEAWRRAGRLLMLQEIIVTRDGLGKVIHCGADTLYAVFENASGALNRALEIQRVLDGGPRGGVEHGRLRVRIGLHTGELLVKEGERLEVIGRHVTRGRKVMESAAPGQILASEEVTSAARDLVDIPKGFLGIEYFGEYYLKGVGATGLCEVADLRFRKPEAPPMGEARSLESAVMGRLDLAGYRALERLGEGPFGVVYKAEQHVTGRVVAVKVLGMAWAEDASTRQRFAAELARVRRVGAAGVVSVLNERLDHRPPFFVMEMVGGRPLDVALEGESGERVARVFGSVGRVLAEMHAAGLVHGDLKPSNVLIDGEDTPVVLDFGMVCLAGERQGAGGSEVLPGTAVMGTVSYAAPECLRGEAATYQSDVYALGVLLFVALTGREPFVGESIHEVVEAHLHEDPPLPGMLRPNVPDGLQRICLKAMEKNAVDRYAGLEAMVTDLDRFIRRETIRTRPSSYDNLLFHRVRQHVEQVGDWARRGLLNPEEHNRLLGVYEGLQRRGVPAVMEGRHYRFWQIVVYLGGWAILNGILFWLVGFWDELGRGTKLGLGAVPALTAFGLSAAMWRLERFRLTFVALIVAIVAVPLAVGVWLHEFEIARVVPVGREGLELFVPVSTTESAGLSSGAMVDGAAGGESRVSAGGSVAYPVTNGQLFWSALAALVAGIGVMYFTQTTLHSGQVVLAAGCCYSVGLLWWGLRPSVEANDWARVGLLYVPLLVVVCGVAEWLRRVPGREYQAGPWHYGGALLLIGIVHALSLDALEELGVANVEHAGTYLLLAGAGAVQAWIGLMARRRLAHRSRGATWLVIFVGLLNVIVGLGMAGWEDRWPEGWWRWDVFAGVEQGVPIAHMVLPLVCLVIASLACREQMLSFLFAGLAGFAVSVHMLGYLYFEEVQAWPQVLIVFGGISLAVALYFELHRTRGNTLDDVVTRSRL